VAGEDAAGDDAAGEDAADDGDADGYDVQPATVASTAAQATAAAAGHRQRGAGLEAGAGRRASRRERWVTRPIIGARARVGRGAHQGPFGLIVIPRSRRSRAR